MTIQFELQVTQYCQAGGMRTYTGRLQAENMYQVLSLSLLGSLVFLQRKMW